MPRRSAGARLYLEPEEFDAQGKRQRYATWVIRDGARKIRTGCPGEDRAGAEAALGEYLAEKHGGPSRDRGRYPDQILVLDALNIYLTDVVSKDDYARSEEAKRRILTLGEWWQPYTLADVNGTRCRDYTAWRTKQQRRSAKPEKTGNPARPITEAMARRELEDLRAAINHHRKEGYCCEIVSVVLPEKPAGRDVWLTRSEAARLLWAAWRAKQVMRDKNTIRSVGRHVARFILIGLYTGTRSAAICSASYMRTVGRGYLDLERGVFHRRARGASETKKRQPPVRLPPRLLAHLRRWKRLVDEDGERNLASASPVEWNGKRVANVRKGFAAAVVAAGLPTTGDDRVTPHTLRHTAATWLMQNGADLWEAAGFLGMTPEMLRDRYGHHHPDFQQGAADALTRRPRTAR